MNWFKKLFSIGVNSINDAGEKAVDSLIDVRREGNAIIRDIDTKIKQLDKSIEEAQVEVSLAKGKIEVAQKTINSLNLVVERAVEANSDEDALNALTRIETEELMIESYQLTVDSLEPLVKQQLDNVRNMNTERNQIHNEILRLDVEEKAYKTRLKLMGGDATDMKINVSDLRERVQRMKAKVEAKEVISTAKGEDLIKKYEVSGVRASVQDRLDAIKQGKENSI